MSYADMAEAILQYSETQRAELKALAESSRTGSPYRREWNAVRTCDWLTKDAKGEPPSFGSWLLIQTDRADNIGLFAREYEETTFSAVARTTTEVVAYWNEMGGFTDVGRLIFDDARTEFLATAATNGWRNVLRDEHANTGTTHALYRFFGDKGRLLYIGLTLNPSSRWKAHGKDKPWWHEVRNVTIELFPNRASVEAAERTAIQAEQPLYNVVHNRRPISPPPATPPPPCGCETCEEYGDLPMQDRPEWKNVDPDDARLADILTPIDQPRLGVPADPVGLAASQPLRP